MDKQIKVFEPAMCCASGMCGPAPDKRVVDFNSLIKRVGDCRLDGDDKIFLPDISIVVV